MSESQAFDVLVVGGGATGAGVLRDLSRRGLRSLLVERGDFGTGTTGRYHGLLHSGGRYAMKDSNAARECIAENRVLRRIAPASIEDTGGYFVATPDDPDDYVEQFPAACAKAGIDCEEIPVAQALRREPALNPKIRRVFRLPDGSVEPWNLIDANLADARAHGSEAWSYHRVVAFEKAGERITAATVRDERSGTTTKVSVRFVVSAAGAWAGQIASMAGVQLEMRPGKGVMLIYNQRMTDTVVNRCHKSSDGDIMVPVHTVAILGTTDVRVADPDVYEVSREEVAALIAEGEKLFPGLGKMRLLRTYAGVRPLYQPPADIQAADNRAVSRAHTIVDHGDRDGVDNYVSIVGGKLTTFRLMAEDTVNAVCARLGVTEPCTTADAILPGQVPGKTYWLGHRLAEHEAEGGGDAALICECEFVTRPMLNAFLDEHWPCSIDDLRRGTRLGMGPCQGGYCTFRAAGLVAERGARAKSQPAAGVQPAAGASLAGGQADEAIVSYFRERFKGTRPIAAGRQLQELWMVLGMYHGPLGVESLIDRVPASQAAPATQAAPGKGKSASRAGAARPAKEALDAQR
jgi:glycerol-3-phosphate dehydrogenase